MNGKQAKSLRRLVEDRFKFLADVNLYRKNPRGTVVLDPRCQRQMYKKLKKAFKAAKKNNSISWRRFTNARQQQRSV